MTQARRSNANARSDRTSVIPSLLVDCYLIAHLESKQDGVGF